MVQTRPQYISLPGTRYSLGGHANEHIASLVIRGDDRYADRLRSSGGTLPLTARDRYASLLLAGLEQLDGDRDGDGGSSCGREAEAADVRATAEAEWNASAATTAVEQLELAVRDGSHRAAFMLATLMLSGIGGTAAHGLPAPGTILDIDTITLLIAVLVIPILLVVRGISSIIVMPR